MAISPQRLTIYLYSAHRAVIFAIAQLSCYLLTFSLYALTQAFYTDNSRSARRCMRGRIGVNQIYQDCLADSK